MKLNSYHFTNYKNQKKEGGLIETIAVYPGSFDPLTYGHLDLVQRALKLFNKLIIAIVENPTKEAIFTLKERVEMIKEVTKNYKNIEIDCFKGLLVDYLQKRKVSVIIRGLRAISDFEYEFQMALMNRELNKNIETIFMMPSVQYTFLSAKLIKEIAKLKGDISTLVPPLVVDKLKKKYG